MEPKDVRISASDDKREIFNLINYCFPDLFLMNKYDEENFNSDQYLLCESDNKDISAVMIVKQYLMNYGKKKVLMGGVSRVATKPTKRKQGYYKKLIKYALEYMYKSGMVFSALHPFLFSFYRKYGWEYAYDKLEYQLAFDAVSGLKNNNYSFRILSAEKFSSINSMRDTFYSKYQGSIMITDSLLKEKNKLIGESQRFICAAYNQNNELNGYVVYSKDNGTIIVKELGWLDIDVYQALWWYIYLHNSQCDKIVAHLPIDDPLRFIIDEPNRKMMIRPDMMLRTINLKSSFELRSYQEKVNANIIIGIKDEYAPWNNANWLLSIVNGSCNAEKTLLTTSLVMDIKTYTQLAIGFRSVDDLGKAGKLGECSDENIRILNLMFQKSITYMNEQF